MKNDKPVEEKLRQSVKAVTLLLTVCIIIGALILFFSKPFDLFTSVVVPAVALLTIPLIWILYYLILTICKISEYMEALNENFVSYAKSSVKRHSDDKTGVA